jgi:hypothetical protein
VNEEERLRWKSRIRTLIVTPKLRFKQKKLSRKWLENYLKNPVPLRPHLGATMPRLRLSEEEVRVLASELGEDVKDEAPKDSLKSLEKGQSLFRQYGCNSCHEFSRGIDEVKFDPSQKSTPIRRRMAPDLRYARKRLSYKYTTELLTNPALRAESGMPSFDLKDDEVENLVNYIFFSPLSSNDLVSSAYQPKLLQRDVRFNEVNTRIFDKVCRHCHFDPKVNQVLPGDGGPGGTGGFGFSGNGVFLNSFETVTSAQVTKLIFGKDDEGISLMVRSLINRHLEVEGDFKHGVLGMPLGLPPIPLDDIDLLHTWIEQGAKK